MSQAELDHACQLIADLRSDGVYLWHNRGRLFAVPWERVKGDDRRDLQRLKPFVLAALKRWPLAPESPEQLVAPRPPDAGGYIGGCPRKPWEYELAVVLPTLGNVDLLEVALRCWRAQTVSPYFIVIDTGSPASDVGQVEALRSYDCEVHTIRSHGWRHSSSPVSAALDLAFAVSQQPAALLTHVDAFPRHERVIEDLLGRLDPSCPVVGYQMSRRVGSQEWVQCVSHTLTCVDMLVMRRYRICWNLLATLEADGEVEQRFLGWPDTETQFGRAIRAAGIVPQFLGGESNASVYQNDLIVHWRSAPSVRHYLPDQQERRHPGLADWLAATRVLGVAAPLPAAILDAARREAPPPA